jgi:polysaccharide export outer membrane protein
MRIACLNIMAIQVVLVISLCAASAQAPGGVGGAITLGPVPQSYFQPLELSEANLLASLMLVKPPPILITNDDLLKISVFGVKEFDAELRVEQDGTISIPYLGAVAISGLTVPDAEQLITRTLVDKKIVLQPAVRVTIEQQPSSVIVVSGEVSKPGSFPSYGNPTLDRVIAGSGGFLADASPIIRITRKGFDHPIYVPLGPDPQHSLYGSLPLLVGDHILVSKVGSFYVVGAVKAQGVYALKATSPTTVAQAIAAAGGFGFEAILDDTEIARTEGDHRILIRVPAGKILKGKHQDIALLNDDIVFIPTSATKAAIKGGATGLIVSLASTYIYAHP